MAAANDGFVPKPGCYNKNRLAPYLRLQPYVSENSNLKHKK